MTLEEARNAWRTSGFFVFRQLLESTLVERIESEVVQALRNDPPERHPGEIAYLSGSDLYVYPETGASSRAQHAEDRISKVFNCHVCGAAREAAEDRKVTDVVSALLEQPNIDCFQSQFIFKNPGVIGQPWHQDSYYFRFDRQPQVGVWLALSAATIENGCLWVIPGSHREGRIFEHIPDRRPAANRGYMEIVNQDTSAQIPVLMDPGDVLFFHSYLMHRSSDNVASARRTAMVYHYGIAGTRPLSADVANQLSNVNRWRPARRSATQCVEGVA